MFFLVEVCISSAVPVRATGMCVASAACVGRLKSVAWNKKSTNATGVIPRRKGQLLLVGSDRFLFKRHPSRPAIFSCLACAIARRTTGRTTGKQRTFCEPIHSTRPPPSTVTEADAFSLIRAQHLFLFLCHPGTTTTFGREC